MSMKKLNELIDELNGKIIVKDNTIEQINERTVRVVKPEFAADADQFYYAKQELTQTLKSIKIA